MLEQIASLVRLDFSPRHEQPAWWRVVLATVASIVGSLAADALLVAVGEHVLHVSSAYQHFHLSDYGKLTVIGVIIACVAWPITTRISSDPRWVFFRMAILVTLVLWLPDVYILVKGQPAKAVAVLMVMHLAIALVTYNLLVHLAPVHEDHAAARRAPAHSGAPGRASQYADQYADHPDQYANHPSQYADHPSQYADRDDGYDQFYRRRDVRDRRDEYGSRWDGYDSRQDDDGDVREDYDDRVAEYRDRPGEYFGQRNRSGS